LAPISRSSIAVVAVCAALWAGACGGGGTNPSGNSGGGSSGGGGTGGGSTTTTTFTITNSGVSPKNATIAAGSQVTFVNNSSAPVDMASNPHPAHTDCPDLNAVGFLNPGQSRSATLRTARTCGFHDHNNSDNTATQGTIVVQ
jgi:hypothetical protein